MSKNISSEADKDLRPRVSVIIPAYNYARFLCQAIESVLGQSLENWECIVVDDGSTDNTEAVVKPFAEKDHRIKFIRQRNRGLAAARNTGILNSTGEYLQF